MALTVNTNTSSVNALTNLNNTSRSLAGSFERISSGLRVTKAADDAAGLGVAENLDSLNISSRQAMRNTNDGISVIQTAESATNEVSSILKRMRELAVQGASETLATTERQYIQDEYEALNTEVERIAQVTEFNGIQLTDGTLSSLAVQVGANAGSDNQIDVTLGNLASTVLGVDTTAIDMSTAAGASSAITTLDGALDTVNQYRSDYGSTQNRLDSALNNLEAYSENLSSAESQIRDADFAYETAEMSKFQVMQQAGLSVLAQANQLSSGVMNLL